MNETKPNPETEPTTDSTVPTTDPATSTTTAPAPKHEDGDNSAATSAPAAPAAEPAPAAPTVDSAPATPSEGTEANSAHDEHAAATSTATAAKSPVKTYAIVALLVLLMGVVLWFLLEREGRVATGVFDGVFATLDERTAVATVNGATITQTEYIRSVDQLTQSAAAQGADTTDPMVVEDIEAQALESLINTELLLQAAAEAGITTNEDAVEARYQEIVDQLGGEEAMVARMTELGLDSATVRTDVRNEIIIQELLDGVVADLETEVTDEEVQALYDNAGGAEAGLPPLEEVRDQIVGQIEFEAEQTAVESYVEGLRDAADIETEA